jgi:hypothetical protein
METTKRKPEVFLKKSLKPEVKIKLPKIKLGMGRDLAEIDYDAVFDNTQKK